MSANVLELVHAVQNVRDWLNTAGDLASRMACDEDGKPVGWKEMDAVADALASAYNGLAGVLDPIATAIKDATDYADHMSDLADGQSY